MRLWGAKSAQAEEVRRGPICSTASRRSPVQRGLGARQKLVSAVALVLVLGAFFAGSAFAWEDVFQPREWVGPYGEGLHSPDTYIIEIQGEGFQYEACVDLHSNGGSYENRACASKDKVAYSHPGGVEGYARVWNAKGYKNEIWGWEYS